MRPKRSNTPARHFDFGTPALDLLLRETPTTTLQTTVATQYFFGPKWPNTTIFENF